LEEIPQVVLYLLVILNHSNTVSGFPLLQGLLELVQKASDKISSLRWIGDWQYTSCREYSAQDEKKYRQSGAAVICEIIHPDCIA
jgi:hypothetical protein